MLEHKIVKMQLAGQFILNYNMGFILIILIICVFSMISLRIIYLQSEEKRLEEL